MLEAASYGCDVRQIRDQASRCKSLYQPIRPEEVVVVVVALLELPAPELLPLLEPQEDRARRGTRTSHRILRMSVASTTPTAEVAMRHIW